MIFHFVEGRQVGNFRVVSKLGQGGMGVVYLAEHPRIGRKAAIKFIRPDQGGTHESVERFASEAWAANSIGHPNIVEIFDFGALPDGEFYIVMEYLEGETLAARLSREKRLPIPMALRLAWQTASGLHAAHGKGIVHRDLKPDNLFLVGDSSGGHERLKILDFGLAKLLDPMRAASVHTGAGEVIGTPVYASPEQLRGRKIDQRSDVYSLGLILYEMVCGRPPFFSKALAEIVNMHLREPIPSARAANPDVSEHLERVILSALKKNPESRFPHMAFFAQALTADPAWTGPKELAAHPESPRTPFAVPVLLEEVKRKAGERAKAAARRRRRRWLAGGVAAAALAAAALAAPAFLRRFGPPGSGGREAVSGAPNRGPTDSADDEAGATYLDQAQAFAASGRFTSALAMLEKARALKSSNPAFNIRLVNVGDAIETKVLVSKAKRLLEVGQFESAVSAAKAALDRDSSNPEAIAVLIAVRDRRDESHRPGTASRPAEAAPAAPSGTGLVSVTTRPSGSVYLNDVPLGASPIRERLVPAGHYVIEVRAHGYHPVRQEVTVVARRPVSLSFTLTADSAEEAPPTVAAVNPEDRPPAPALASPRPSPAETEAPGASAATKPTPVNAKQVFSNPPRRDVPAPALPRERSGPMHDLAAALREVEAQAVARAGVSPEFAADVTRPLLNALGDKSEATIYPAALYYVLVREAALTHDKAAAGRNLREAHFGGGLRPFLALPTEER